MNLIPIIVMGAITFLGLGIAIAEHGKEKKTKPNFWDSVISAIIWWGLVYLTFFI